MQEMKEVVKQNKTDKEEHHGALCSPVLLHIAQYTILNEPNIVAITNARSRRNELNISDIIPYPTAFPYGNGMVLHFYQQQESSTTKTVHKVINKGLKTYV